MRSLTIGDNRVEYERKGAGWYSYTVRHMATNRKLFSRSCCVELSKQAPPLPNGAISAARAAWSRIDDAVREHAMAELRAYEGHRSANSEAYAHGKFSEVKGEKDLPGLPPKRQEELREKGRIVITAAVPQRIIRQAYDVALKATGDVQVAERAALKIGHQVLIGVADDQLLAVARRTSHLVGDSDVGIVLRDGAEAAS